MTARMRRVSPDTLEALSFARNRRIEVDREQGIDVCTVDGVTYYAAHDDKVRAS